MPLPLRCHLCFFPLRKNYWELALGCITTATEWVGLKLQGLFLYTFVLVLCRLFYLIARAGLEVEVTQFVAIAVIALGALVLTS